MNTKNKGNIGEAKVIADLVAKDFDVAQPFGDNLPFDLLVIDNKLKVYKVQVKYSSQKQGSIVIRNQKWSSNTKRNYVKYYTGIEVDIFAVYCPDNDSVYYVRSSDVIGKTGMTIRTQEARNNQHRAVHWHENFRTFPQ